MAHHFNFSRKLSWYDRLSININGVKTSKSLLNWYKHDPCAVIIDNVEQKGPYIAQAVYKKFTEYACTCRERDTHNQ